ncbi:Molybdopterin biosynthesis protein CNX1 [Porphyridium purpureum]|uniref:Molybdopterin biosynthesis protein CNX1 n=1 Tax=Porphyridium purpureum TaxID=35688 RepID=A0A5J4Z440_PORPP|nr:Molybdopterin biosynthesis protein CNX1 [Porphyridium purpureum]|eukprot:POR5361..scf295_1
MESERDTVRKSLYEMVDMERAIEQVVSTCQDIFLASSKSGAGYSERVPLSECYGRVLADDLFSVVDVPGAPVSMKDGYAVRMSDFEAPVSPQHEAAGTRVFAVKMEMHATQTGEEQIPVLPDGCVAYVATGAVLPLGADAVVMVENTRAASDESVEILKAPYCRGQDIRPRGVDLAKGQLVLSKSELILEAEIGLLAACGVSHVSVIRPPVVGVLSTGDEVVDVSESRSAALSAGSTYDSNRPMLLAACAAAHAQVVDLGIVHDHAAELERTFMDACAKCDLIVTSGGVSMGRRDLLQRILASKGTVHFGRVRMKPGKPLTFATLLPNAFEPDAPPLPRTRVVLSLPGNPVSSFVCLHLVVIPAIRSLQGHASPLPPIVDAVLAQDVKLDPERPEYHRATLVWNAELGAFQARSTGVQQSSRLLSARSANAFLVLPALDETLKSGSKVRAMLIMQERLNG